MSVVVLSPAPPCRVPTLVSQVQCPPRQQTHRRKGTARLVLSDESRRSPPSRQVSALDFSGRASNFERAACARLVGTDRGSSRLEILGGLGHRGAARSPATRRKR